MESTRGSEKLLTAWKERQALTDESVSQIAELLDSSPAEVESVEFHGGAEPTGVSLGLAFSGDDVELCPRFFKDLFEWLKTQPGRGPIVGDVIINGTPRIDLARVNLSIGEQRFGHR